MATTVTSASFFCLLIWILNVISSYPAASSKTTSPVKPRKWTIKLIHHDSIQSPYYNPNATIAERAELAINGSLARIRSLSRNIATPNEDDVRADLIPAAKIGFLAKISIGTPPVPQLVHIDTGSDLLWIQCLPCIGCFNQSSPLFDPTKSSTYSYISCDSRDCSSLGAVCHPNHKYCVYQRSYGDKTSTAGTLATEQATFETSDEGTVKVPIEVFGCGHRNNNPLNGPESGILGLGYGFYRLPTVVKHFGSKFSYCIGNIRDAQYQYNQLILGEGAIIQGDSTSLETYKGLYYLELQGISVGEKQLPIDPKVFQRGDSGEGGVMIDSGTSFTFLTKEAYVPLQNEVMSLMAGHLNKVNHPRWLCYAGNMDRDLTGFPVVTLQFSGGAQLSLDTNSMFIQLNPNVLCMALIPALPESNGQSVIGVMAQQSYNIGYDIGQGKIFIQRIDCQVLESIL